MPPENPVRAKLRNGETVYGVFVTIPAPEIVELCALVGFDFVLLDGEHGRINPDNAFAMILAGERRNIPVMARVGERDRQMVLKYLDLGLAGVVVPQIVTAEAAAEAVTGMRYHPQGIRGFAGGRMFEFGLGAAAKELVQPLNDRVLSAVQFEHIDALAQLDAILAVPDLDVLFIGPNDLAQSMGYPGQPAHPEVQAVIDEVLQRMQGSPVAPATVTADATHALALAKRGFRMLVPNAVTMLAQGATGFIKGVRPA